MLSRRRFTAALFAIPVAHAASAQADSTPVPVNEAFTVTWWVVDSENPSYPVFRGDVLNTSGQLLDAPVIGITAYDPDGNIVGSSYATPEPSTVAPGERAFLSGSAPEDLPDDVEMEFFVCEAPGATQEYVAQNAVFDLTLEVSEEEREDSAFRAVGTVLNNGAEPAANVSVVALFSNPDGAVIGALSTRLDRDIPSGKSMRWEVDHGFDVYQPSHPFIDLLEDDYEVTYWVGFNPGARGIFC